MALEDIDEAGEEPKLDLEQVMLDANAGTDPQGTQDEDLFDLPDMAASAADREAATGAAGGPSGDLAAVESIPEDSPVAGTPGSPGHDPELDEDLFDFGAIFAGGDIVLDAGTEVVVAPDTISVVTEASLDTTPQPEDEAQAAVPAPIPAPVPPPAENDRTPALETVAAAVTSPVPIHVTAGSGRDRPVMVLAAVVLLVNTALILFAWQANNSFRGTIGDVTRSLAEGLANANAPAQAAPRVEYVPVPSSEDTVHARDSRPSGIESHSEQAIVIARRLMSEGRFIDARHTLCDLLSNADLLSLDRELVAEAEFLIAETYELQGNALLGKESR